VRIRLLARIRSSVFGDSFDYIWDQISEPIDGEIDSMAEHLQDHTVGTL